MPASLLLATPVLVQQILIDSGRDEVYRWAQQIDSHSLGLIQLLLLPNVQLPATETNAKCLTQHQHLRTPTWHLRQVDYMGLPKGAIIHVPFIQSYVPKNKNTWVWEPRGGSRSSLALASLAVTHLGICASCLCNTGIQKLRGPGSHRGLSEDTRILLNYELSLSFGHSGILVSRDQQGKREDIILVGGK